MNRPLNGIRRHRGLLALVAITWLPFVSMRCIEGVTEGCPVLGTAHEHGEDGSQGDGHDHHAEHAQGRGAADHGHDRSNRTCCELTGKFAVEVTSGTTSAPLVPLATWVRPSELLPRLSAKRPVQRVADPTHHPPPYLLFATLLI